MVRLKLCGFETGDTSEAVSTTGTLSVQSTTKRTGTYALVCNPSFGNSAWFNLGKLAANGTSAAIGADAWARFYFRFSANPSNTMSIAGFFNAVNGSTRVASLELSTTGGLSIVGSGAVTSVANLSPNTWYRIELRAANGGTCGCKVDGGTETTTTGAAQVVNYLCLGMSAGRSSDHYYDDVAIDDAAYPGAGQVNILKPNATGTTSAWTNGAGTSPTNVAEVPHDSNTSYIRSATISDETTVNLDSSATGGVSGTIAAVQVVGIVRDEGGASGVSVRAFNSGNYDIGTTTVDPGSTYTALSKIFTTDPNTSAAWTTSGLDALEIGVRNMASVAVRCTALYAMVESSGAVAATGYTNLPLMGVG